MDQGTRVVPVQMLDGSQILVAASAVGGEEDVAAVNRLMSFGAVTKTIEDVASCLNETLTKLKPRRASVEFGIELAVQAGQLAAPPRSEPGSQQSSDNARVKERAAATRG